MHARLLAWLLLCSSLGLAACGGVAGQHVSRITPSLAGTDRAQRLPVQPALPPCTVTAPASAPLRTGSHIDTVSTAYRDLLKDFVRPLSPDLLLTAAWQGATAEAVHEAKREPAVATPLLDTSTANADWQNFAGAYGALVQATEGHVDQVQMAFAAVARMDASVNEGHTYFVPPAAFAQEGKETRFSGIGVTLTGTTSPFVVGEVVSGGPAARGGMRPGDMIVGVNGCSVSSLNSTQLSERIRGTAGTPVRLEVQRPRDIAMEFDLTREVITFPAIEWRMAANHTGYLQLHSFPSSHTELADGHTLSEDLQLALASFRHAHARGWILDLRGNPGGLVDGLQAFAGGILPAGEIFSFRDRAGATNTVKTTTERINGPPLLAVLVDGGSASAAEILSSAIQEEHVAPIVGTHTAGVANGATLVAIGDGAGMSITHWQTYTVNGTPLNGNGVTPNITVENTATGTIQDPQLQRALQLPTP